MKVLNQFLFYTVFFNISFFFHYRFFFLLLRNIIFFLNNFTFILLILLFFSTLFIFFRLLSSGFDSICSWSCFIVIFLYFIIFYFFGNKFALKIAIIHHLFTGIMDMRFSPNINKFNFLKLKIPSFLLNWRISIIVIYTISNSMIFFFKFFYQFFSISKVYNFFEWCFSEWSSII